MLVAVLLIVYNLCHISCVYGAECKGKVTANLEVTGAFTKTNGTHFHIKSNEYAEFSCSGNAETGVELESLLEVSCHGSSTQQIQSPAGTGMVTARWQSNDQCWFVSSCTLKCSSSTDCDNSGVQVYDVTKVISIEKSQADCSESFVQHCTDKGDIVQTLTRNKPLGNGRFRSWTSCSGTNKSNNTTTSVYVVRASADECECSTTFIYQETTSKGEICDTPVFNESMVVRNEEYCTDGLSAEMIAFMVLFFLALLCLAWFLTLKWPRRKLNLTILKNPGQDQMERMTAMDLVKLNVLIEDDNDPEVDDSAKIS